MLRASGPGGWRARALTSMSPPSASKPVYRSTRSGPPRRYGRRRCGVAGTSDRQLSNFTFDRTPGSRSLAAAGQRGRWAAQSSAVCCQPSPPSREVTAIQRNGENCMSTTDLDHAIERSHQALAAIINGDSSGYKALFSNQEDITLGNPFGPYARGRKNVEKPLDGA